VAQSTCEAEYYSAADATKKVLHLGQVMGEIFNAPITETTTIWEDNQSAMAYSHNALVCGKTTHIGMKWHFFKDYVDQGTIKLRNLPNDKRAADMFTKPLPGHAPTRHRSVILGGAYPNTQYNASSRSNLQGECLK
jgi:hypothetical protein